ncbi:glycoside hydrolase family 16 protein [Trichoderma citrinoviride]|uniref:Glycoside hydrolase family 16 protein n=1 Tax=Trichoderma citrinoviride TaxID=58853 RepID=A0A2T4AXT0_9HYPO|nr:glycoside hydrolase family 16 protein [Trichoderma citrinoviride]PTB61882.1 glycoside hydrolase family 16 protein [Trichoderma citrinoviride]
MSTVMEAQSLNFVDDCTTFNSDLWKKANWRMGLGSVLAANVNPSGGGVLNFEIPVGTHDGGEIVSKAQYPFGQVAAQFKVPDLPGIISSIFMYQGTSTSDEIDIEVYLNKGRWEVAFTVYRLGVKSWSKGYFPTWDPSSGYFDYMIDYQEDAISFYANGEMVAKYATPEKQPIHPMNIQLNAWFPAWLQGKPASATRYLQVNQISYTQS